MSRQVVQSRKVRLAPRRRRAGSRCQNRRRACLFEALEGRWLFNADSPLQPLLQFAEPDESLTTQVAEETATFWVTNTNDSGPGSLRQAILGANHRPGPDVIKFAIPVTDPHFVDADWWMPGGDPAPDVFVISPTSSLPRLVDPGTTIDGWTQRKFTGDTNPFGPEIVLDGSSAGNAHGLVLEGDNCAVYALNIHSFAGSGMRLLGDQNALLGNYVGTDPTGPLPSRTAVLASNSRRQRQPDRR